MIVSINLFKSHWYGWEYLSNVYASGTLAKTNGNAKSYCLNVGTYDYLAEPSMVSSAEPPRRRTRTYAITVIKPVTPREMRLSPPVHPSRGPCAST